MLSVMHSRHTKSIAPLLHRKRAGLREEAISRLWFECVNARTETERGCSRLAVSDEESSEESYRQNKLQLPSDLRRRYLCVLTGSAPPRSAAEPIGARSFEWPAHCSHRRLSIQLPHFKPEKHKNNSADNNHGL